MTVALIPLLIVVAILIVVGGILFFIFGQRLKGGIILSLDGGHFRPGHDIAGVLTVTAKKALGPGNLVTSLVCIEEWWEWDTDSDGDRTRRKKTREVYRQVVDLAPNLSMGQGEVQTVPFVLRTPQPQDTVNRDDEPGWMQTLRQIGSAFSPDREIYWKVEGRYDIKGLDITAEEKIPLSYQFN